MNKHKIKVGDSVWVDPMVFEYFPESRSSAPRKVEVTKVGRHSFSLEGFCPRDFRFSSDDLTTEDKDEDAGCPRYECFLTEHALNKHFVRRDIMQAMWERDDISLNTLKEIAKLIDNNKGE